MKILLQQAIKYYVSNSNAHAHTWTADVCARMMQFSGARVRRV
jgi:hypothetical protein